MGLKALNFVNGEVIKVVGVEKPTPPVATQSYKDIRGLVEPTPPESQNIQSPVKRGNSNIESPPKVSTTSFNNMRKIIGPTIQDSLPLEEISTSVVKEKIKKKKPSSRYMEDMLNSDE
jgi:hypothetical protein